MPIHTREITDILNETADLLDIKGENQFRIRSYRSAAQVLSNYSDDLEELVKNQQRLQSMQGIGKSMAKKIQEIAKTGKLEQLDHLKEELPSSLLEIMHLEQIGPKKTRQLHKKLQVNSIDELKELVKKGKVRELDGFGIKTSESILREIEQKEEGKRASRMPWPEAEDYIHPLIEYLETKKLKNISVAGSYRRKQETIGDIDILATSRQPEKHMDAFVAYDEVERVSMKGKTKTSVKLRSGLQVDLRLVEKKSYGAALQYFTGSKDHNIAIRKMGQQKNYKINEYGVFKGNKAIAGKSEKELYKALGMQYVPPELRENKGEIEAARKNKLPNLIELKDIKGDLQTHTTASDGKNSLEEMVQAAMQKGYEYYAVTDHSKRVTVANGLDEKRLEKQLESIDELNRKMKKIRILKSAEVDILEDGSLDLDDSILKELDLVVCSIHYNLKLPEKKQTRRILKAMENPYFNILAHPTGRIIGKREGYLVDMPQIMREAKVNGCFLEINANAQRLDLNANHIRMAKDIGLKLSISTDAHAIGNLDYMKYGIDQARRGWLESSDCINTLPWKKLKKLLKRA